MQALQQRTKSGRSWRKCGRGLALNALGDLVIVGREKRLRISYREQLWSKVQLESAAQ